MRAIAAFALLLLGCSPAERDRPSREAQADGSLREDVVPPETSVFIGLAATADSALPAARARGGHRGARVDGTAASPCKDHPPSVVYSEYGGGRLVLEVGISVPELCMPRWETHVYTALVEHLPAGRYPVEVRMRVRSSAPGIPSSDQVVLRDTIDIRE